MVAVEKGQGVRSNSSAAKSASFPKGVGKPAIRALASAGYTQLDQLVNANEKDLAKLHGMGPKALRIIGEALKDQGKSFQR